MLDFVGTFRVSNSTLDLQTALLCLDLSLPRLSVSFNFDLAFTQYYFQEIKCICPDHIILLFPTYDFDLFVLLRDKYLRNLHASNTGKRLSWFINYSSLE